jgi:pSer/pThr/pTyr-binding forkhead associated (FHA) protein
MNILLLIIRLLIAAALYAFIAWTVYTLWIEVYRKGLNKEKNSAPTLIIKFADEQGEKIQYITRPVAIMGREQDCDVCIADRSVSSRQARFSYHQNQWWIEDLNSTNGTFLNRDLLRQPAVLVSDDLISCGNTDLNLQIEKVEN